MPMLSAIEPVAAALESLTTGAPVVHGALTMVPLLAPHLADPEWLTLAEAGDQVQITEVSEGGSVADLSVANGAASAVLLLDGEELIGAKQNRVLNTSVLVGAGARVDIPVSCVEQGRWSYRSRAFVPSDSSLYASVRRAKAAAVTGSVRRGRGHRSDQAGIWDELAAKDAAFRIASPTGAMHDFYARHAEDVADARQALAARPGQVGAVLYVSGSWVGLDVVGSARLFASAWERLAAGYVADALGRTPDPRLAPSPRAVLRRLPACPAEAAPAPGLGREYRLTAPDTSGAVLVLGDRLVHLMAFPGARADGETSPADRTP